MRAKIILTLSLFISSMLYSCTTDSYEKGEGEYSLLQADFVEAHSNAYKQIDYVETDDGERLTLSQPYERNWIKTPDSLYRSILYYKRAGKTVDLVTMAQVNVATIVRTDSLEKRMKSKVKTDPLTLESVWISKSKRYLNASVYLKVGSTDNQDAIHKMGIVCDTIMTNADSTHTLHLRLYHDQGGVPEYYSQRTYFSIPLTALKADSLRLCVNTYKGEVVKAFKIK